MKNQVKRMTVETAMQDLQGHTLAGMPSLIAQLVYLASTRDYNTGRYYHDGLAFRYTEEVACTALAAQHSLVFRELVSNSIEHLVQQLESYMNSSNVVRADFVNLWNNLAPYRVTAPVDSDELAVQLFYSNVKIALAILQSHYEKARAR